jgi:hypothetical protein
MMVVEPSSDHKLLLDIEKGSARSVADAAYDSPTTKVIGKTECGWEITELPGLWEQELERGRKSLSNYRILPRKSHGWFGGHSSDFDWLQCLW